MSPVERDQGPQPVMFPAPIAAPHPTVAAPKCVDCQHHQQGPAGHNSRAHLCGHPVVPRSLVTGTPAQLCCDMRNDGPAGYMPAPGAVSQRCGAEGRLFTAQAVKTVAFLSGEADPLELGSNDRRYFVSRTDPDQIVQRATEWHEKHGQPAVSVTADEPSAPAVHPNRGHPLCGDCRWISGDAAERTCNHPSMPVYTTTGKALLGIGQARAQRGACGPTATLFAAISPDQSA